MTEEAKDEFLTYTATRAFLAKDENRTVLYMENGLIQTIDTSSKDLSTTEFRSVAIDLSDSIRKKGLVKYCLSYHTFRLGC